MRKSKLIASTLSLFLVCTGVTGCKNTSEEPPAVSVGGTVFSSDSLQNSSSSGSSSSTSFNSSTSFAGSVSLSEVSSSSSIGFAGSTGSAAPPESSVPPELPPESSVEPEPVPEPELPSDPIQRKIAQMTLREKVYQMFFVTPEQLGGGDPVTTAMNVTTRPVGGVICMGKNLKSGSQTKSMISGTQSNAMNNGIGLFFAVDEEGGTVARCAAYLGTTKLDPMAVYGERDDYNEAVGIGKTLGRDISQFGFNVDFAPVADVYIDPANELGDRIFSDDPDVVANMVSGVVSGLRSTGVCATLKHFPGLGAESGNSHTASRIVIDRTLSELRDVEFVPFQSGIDAGAEFVMVGHQTVTAFGDDLPADLSYTAVTRYLRGELGFTGIAITDAQNMGTITNLYYPGTAAKMAVKAGIDMILMPDDLDSAANAVINAVKSGEISEERINQSVTRILTLKREMGLLS